MERPDSALSVLKSVDHALLNTKRSRAHHALLHAMALDKNYIDVADDSIAHPMMMSNVQESFACGVAWHLTEKVHPGYYFRYEDSVYTGVVEDMIDDDGHKANNESIPEYVSGYTIQEVENAVYGAWTYAMWKNYLNSQYPNNTTRIYLDDLFDIW